MVTFLRLLWLVGLVGPLCAVDFIALRTAAEAAYAEGSYAQAYQLYLTAPTNLPPADARWLDFRVADSRWRAQGQNLRNEAAEAARQTLEKSFSEKTPENERDLIWAEARESLGDLHDRRGESREWIRSRYGQALDWWAGQSDLETARTRYLRLVWKLGTGTGLRRPGFMGHLDLDLRLLNHAVEIAQRPEDIAHARYLRAQQLAQLRAPDERALYLVEDDFLAALKSGRASEWYAPALFAYAQWLGDWGRLILPVDGTWHREPDGPRALERYRQLVTEFTEGTSEYWGLATAQINALVAEHLGVSVPGAFLPGSEIQFQVAWRNVKGIEWMLQSVNLSKDISFTDPRRGLHDWLQFTQSTIEPVQRGRLEIPDDHFHNFGSTNFILPNRVVPGAYLLTVKGGKSSARELVLVSDVVLTLKTGSHRTLAWLTDVTTGQPVGDARVKLWQRIQEAGGAATWTTQERATDSAGVAAFELDRAGEIFVSAVATGPVGTRPAYALSWTHFGTLDSEAWQLYVFTDRPAYRPREMVQWKLTARQWRGGTYRTPVETQLYFDVVDPRGGKLTNGVARLNAFGSAWGKFTLSSEPVLGEYRIQFWDDAQHRRRVAEAVLFRSEEYKLPEFEVKVLTAEEALPGGGKKPKPFKLGETVEVRVAADYYAGGPVVNGDVEVIVYQSPWRMNWPRWREFPWYYTDDAGGMGRGGFFGGDQILKRETLHTDATGKATVSLETDPLGNDLELRIQARVRDSSRREVSAQGTVRVTRQRYFASAHPLNQVRLPGEKTPIEFRTQDANRQPVSVLGTVKITRERWTEIWLDPTGKEWSGSELDRAKAQAPVWPPPRPPGDRPWRLKHQGYDRDDLATTSLATGTNGLAEFTFTPERDGFYRFAWSSPGNATAPKSSGTRPQPFEPAVLAETTVWVGSGSTTNVGYHSGAIEIILDSDTARLGNRLPVMLVTSVPDSWALFTTEVGDSFDYEVVHLVGTAKLMTVGVEDRHLPNFFLGALSVRDRKLFSDFKEVMVPPTRHFLSVKIAPDKPVYGARESGELVVDTRNAAGQPVSTEVAVSLADDSIYAIQPELAGDPREFFFGQKRAQNTRFETGFNQRQYLRLKRGPPTRSTEVFDDRYPIFDAQVDETARGEDQLAVAASVASPAGEYGTAGRGRAESTSRSMRAVTALSMAPAAPKSADRPMVAAASMPAKSPLSPNVSSTLLVRSDFRATAFWQPDVKTGADGQARIPVTYPDSLTRWRATARAVGSDQSVGWSTTNTQTRAPLMVRLQSPRFLVTGDRCLVASVIMNQTDQPVEVDSRLEATGVKIMETAVAGQTEANRRPSILVPAQGQFTDHWLVEATTAGPVKLKVSAEAKRSQASAPSLGDAMERDLIAYPHGIQKFLAVNGKAESPETEVVLDLPAARLPESTVLKINITPSLAMTLVDALPYLADYPYGCTEQTLSRFLPAVVVRRTLRDLGLDADAVMNHAFGGITTNAAGRVSPSLGQKKNLTQLDEMVRLGLDRLNDFQKADGSWGWWKESASDAWMTAYVVWGWNLALEAGVNVDRERLKRAVIWLERHLVDENRNPGTQVWMLHALAAQHRRVKASEVGKFQLAAFRQLWDNRDRLTSYERGLFTWTAQALGRSAEAQTLVRNLENGVIRGDAANSTLLTGPTKPAGLLAHWGQESGWWRWTDSGVESSATGLRALVAVEPKNRLTEPVVTWLLKNRRGAQWSNTRDSALTILALCDYLRASGQGQGDVAYTVEVNGRELGQVDLRGKPVWDWASRFSLPVELIRDRNVLRLRRTGGSGALYYSLQAEFFTTEEPIAPAGNELFVRREYFRRVGRPTLLKGFVYDREPLRDGEALKSGERVETVLTIETKNDYEYLSFEDLKPAGFEAVELVSGGFLQARRVRDLRATNNAGRRDPSNYLGETRSIYPEWRDRRAVFFADRLPAGFWELRYEFRAEVPGQFHALPVLAQAMYVPELRANSAELRLEVKE